MNEVEKSFLKLICNHIRGNYTSDELNNISGDDLMVLYRMSITHSVFPMFYDAVRNTDAFNSLADDVKKLWKRQAIATVATQAVRSERFFQLYNDITDAGLKCLVVKGIICRQMYPQPDCRTSNDEDIYISDGEFAACHRLILKHGLVTLGEHKEDDFEKIHVISYTDTLSGLHIELHRTLFEEDSKAYGYLNSYFNDAIKNAISIKVDKHDLKTLEYTENLLYLVCHAFKHFVMRGFGIRQLCDILLFAENYGNRIRWYDVEKITGEIGADVFLINLFDIGERYLEFSREKACMKDAFLYITPDSDDLLEDLLDAGIFGKSSESRHHSNSMTLSAMEKRNENSGSKRAALGAVFPGLEIMKKRYTVLNKLPFLLPVMWLVRLFSYLFSKKDGSEDSAKDTLKLGKKRVELLKKYKIIK